MFLWLMCRGSSEVTAGASPADERGGRATLQLHVELLTGSEVALILREVYGNVPNARLLLSHTDLFIYRKLKSPGISGCDKLDEAHLPNCRRLRDVFPPPTALTHPHRLGSSEWILITS